jgi:hypothetical protein
VADSVSSCLTDVDFTPYLKGIIEDQTKPVELLRNCLTLIKHMSASGMQIQSAHFCVVFDYSEMLSLNGGRLRDVIVIYDLRGTLDAVKISVRLWRGSAVLLPLGLGSSRLSVCHMPEEK